MLPGLDEIEDVLCLAEHFHLLIKAGDGEGKLFVGLEIADAEEALLLAADAVGKCAHGNLPGLSGVGGEKRRRTRACVFVPRVGFTHVDRAQPEAAQGRFERTKASDAVDAGHGDERHVVVRKGHDRDGREVLAARGKTCVATEGGAKTRGRLFYPWPQLVPWRAGPPLLCGKVTSTWLAHEMVGANQTELACSTALPLMIFKMSRNFMP